MSTQNTREQCAMYAVGVCTGECALREELDHQSVVGGTDASGNGNGPHWEKQQWDALVGRTLIQAFQPDPRCVDASALAEHAAEITTQKRQSGYIIGT